MGVHWPRPRPILCIGLRWPRRYLYCVVGVCCVCVLLTCLCLVVVTTGLGATRVGMNMCKYLVDVYVVACWLNYTCKHDIQRLSIVIAIFND